MMLKLVDTSQKFIILGIFILDKVTRLRALLDPPPRMVRLVEVEFMVSIGYSTWRPSYLSTIVMFFCLCLTTPTRHRKPRIGLSAERRGYFMLDSSGQ